MGQQRPIHDGVEGQKLTQQTGNQRSIFALDGPFRANTITFELADL